MEIFLVENSNEGSVQSGNFICEAACIGAWYLLTMMCAGNATTSKGFACAVTAGRLATWNMEQELNRVVGTDLERHKFISQ